MKLFKNFKFIAPLILLLATVSCFKDTFETKTEPEPDEGEVTLEETSEQTETEAVDTCTRIKNDAVGLIDGSKNCTSDSDCKVINMWEYITGSCIGAFQCSTAIRKDADLTELKGKMEDLVAQFKSADCQPCAMASCAAVSSDQVGCNTSTKKCEIRR